MTSIPYSLTNKQVRHLWLDLQSLSQAPCGKRHSADFSHRVESLGMVQLDSIDIVSRAHHHILWSRQSAYRPQSYNALLQHERLVFEHFSHDAVILPITTYPYWNRQRSRRAGQYKRGTWGQEMAKQKTRDQIINEIEKNGAQCSRDFTKKHNTTVDKSKHSWMRPAHKLALDYLWLEGTLSVSHREKFTKFYDLTERVIPEKYRDQQIAVPDQINWLCENALNRLGVANASEIQRFWEACDLKEVHAWLKHPSMEIISVTYKDALGQSVDAFAPATLVAKMETIRAPTPRVRIISPFDPVARDRARLKRFFGFDYRIEIYTPKAKRKYGYYVYPIIEGDRFIGRLDLKADKKKDRLCILGLWLEPKVLWTESRQSKLNRELSRLKKLANVNELDDVPTPSISISS